jgi:hypothetical protein
MYHFVITIQHQDRPGSIQQATFATTFNLEAGETRDSAFRKILDWAGEKAGAQHPTVLFFTFEPNELAPATEPATEPAAAVA